MKHRRIDDCLLDAPIDELVRLHPEVVSLMLSSQMDCVGCDFDRLHSLRYALELYQIDPGDFFTPTEPDQGQAKNDHGG